MKAKQLREMTLDELQNSLADLEKRLFVAVAGGDRETAELSGHHQRAADMPHIRTVLQERRTQGRLEATRGKQPIWKKPRESRR